MAEALLAEEVWQTTLLDDVKHRPQLHDVGWIHLANANGETISFQMSQPKLVSMSRSPLHGDIRQLQIHDGVGRRAKDRKYLSRDGARVFQPGIADVARRNVQRARDSM